MSDINVINEAIRTGAPAAFRCLSPLGLRAILPTGIPVQAAQAKHTRFNATIGQITDGHGNPMPLPQVASHLSKLDPKMSHLYSPLGGHAALKAAWNDRQRRFSEGSTAPATTALVTLGLTQSLSHVAALFSDPDTDVVVTDPCWGNYNLVFSMHSGARMVRYPMFDGDGFNLEGLAQALSNVRGKAVVVLNFPSNPTGYQPTPAEAQEIARIVTEHPGPAVVLVDDAYQGLVYEDTCQVRSLYWDIAERADPERTFVIRADGSTKELLFFPGRVGFLTHNADASAADALVSKFLCIARGTVGSPPGPSQALVYAALQDPGLEAAIDEKRRVLRHRKEALETALRATSGRLSPYPFNAGCFALIGVDKTVAVEPLRRRLIDVHDVGVIAFSAVNAIRIAYCSADEAALQTIVQELDAAVNA